MPAARQRPLEDSRSETSSTITNLKDRSMFGLNAATSILKGRKPSNIPTNGFTNTTKALANGPTAPVPELDPNLPRVRQPHHTLQKPSTQYLAADKRIPQTDWLLFSPRTLHAYRQAYRLSASSAYTHPHADLIYKSSRVAKRSPSAVYARRKLRDLKHERRKTPQQSRSAKGKEKTKESHPQANQDRMMLDDEVSAPKEINEAEAEDVPDPSSDNRPHAAPQRQAPAALALTARRHFNSLSLNESEVLTRFLYVVHHSSSKPSTTLPQFPAGQYASLEGLWGNGGDGRGRMMGSQGREVVRNDGAAGAGDLGFRLRFRPEAGR